MFDNIANILACAASLAAVGALVIAYKAYRWSHPDTQLKIRQAENMNKIAATTIELIKQVTLFAGASLGQYELDSYVFPSSRSNCEQLYNHLEIANGLGLSRVFVEHDSTHSWELYLALRQALKTQANLDPKNTDVDDYTKEHFVMGLFRLANQCKGHGDLDPNLKNELNEIIDENDYLVKLAHKYVNEGRDSIG